MSGSYTQTPNLGLFKPTPNSDTGTWGYHLNANADVLDNALPANGGTVTGPLLYTATGGTTSRSLQSRAGEALSATDFGIVCDGVTDQGAKLNTALASLPRGTAMLIPGSLYTSVTITVPNGCQLVMPSNNCLRPATGSTLMITQYAIIGAASLSPVVRVNGGEGGLVNVGITRNGTPAAGSIGLQCIGQDQVYWRCYSYNHARCIQVGPGAITTRFDHCITWTGTEDSVYLLGAPETTFIDHRFGIVGSIDPTAANSLVCIDGNNNDTSAAATNGISFIRCQFNPAATTAHLYTIRCISWHYGILKLHACYSGGAQTAFLYVDPSCVQVRDVSLIDNTISPMASTETLISDGGHKIVGLRMIGNAIDGGVAQPTAGLYLNNSSASLIGNNFGGPFTLQLDSMTGGCCTGNIVNTLSLTGTYTGNGFVVGNNVAATYNQTATGMINYIEPYGNFGSQITLGKTGQAGRIDFRRNVDGALSGWLGINGATLDLTNGGGTPQVRLNASGTGGADIFMVNSVEVGRFSAQGMGAAKVTAAAIAPGAGFATLAFVAGTTAGTGKLVAYCGTSTTPVTIMDNIGAGF